MGGDSSYFSKKNQKLFKVHKNLTSSFKIGGKEKRKNATYSGHLYLHCDLFFSFSFFFWFFFIFIFFPFPFPFHILYQDLKRLGCTRKTGFGLSNFFFFFFFFPFPFSFLFLFLLPFTRTQPL